MSHVFSKVEMVDCPHDMALIGKLARHGEAYRDHALVWRLFPGDGAERDFVFRRINGAPGRLAYYVVSARQPQSVPGLFTVQCKPYSPELVRGDYVRFDLRANPCVTRRTEPNGRSSRHDVLMDAKRSLSGECDAASVIHAAAREWLASRAASWGLVIDGDVRTEGYTQHRLRHRQRSIEYSSLDYQGLARVEDPALLSRALLHGVGHAKAFGCGLLLVRRAS